MHHLVVWNSGEGPDGYDRNDSPEWFANGTGAATGAILKGDYNRFYQNTVFNTSSYGQGDLCATTTPLHAKAAYNVSQQNLHSTYLNSVAMRVTGQGGNVYPKAVFAAWSKMVSLGEKAMGVRVSV